MAIMGDGKVLLEMGGKPGIGGGGGGFAMGLMGKFKVSLALPS